MKKKSEKQKSQPPISTKRPFGDKDWRLLNDIEWSLLAIEGLFESIYVLTDTGDVEDRRYSAICTVSSFIIEETRRAKDLLHEVFERRRK